MSIRPTQIWWLRHGPTHQNNFCGWTDVPADLSDHAAIARISALLPEQAIVTSSDLLRARSTADAIAGARRRLPPSAALREFNFGAWEGMTFTEASARDPELCRRYWEEPGDVVAPGGESWNDAAERAATHVETLISRHPGADLVVVAHMGIILSQIARARACAPREVLSQVIAPLSLTRISHGPDGWRIACINHIA